MDMEAIPGLRAAEEAEDLQADAYYAIGQQIAKAMPTSEVVRAAASAEWMPPRSAQRGSSGNMAY